ncbi:pentapeptide repeat-containing protein [Sphaerisporangium fuscum]|uniref:pentapeptide repeat-containing protein n=1 Tax=Sphaerisporangium fuscum TaxID=2835868 RepID=UPI001BDC9D8D|nr:pentapeptide repeat-containing protein [Sphaerisporangium fuscum]
MTPPLKLLSLDVGWRTCDAAPECLGVACKPYGRCAAHLAPAELEEFLGRLSPGQSVDLRGTTLGEDLLTSILDAAGRRLGRARFDLALFTGPARFGEVVFAGDATFDHARFDRLASFFGTRFTRNASFRDVRFSREFSMHGSRVRGHGAFDHVLFGSDALFGEARFGRDASFRAAEFHGFAAFDAAMFDGDAVFRGTRFRRAVSCRRTVFAGTAGFGGARFHGAVYLTQARVGRRLALTDVQALGPVEIDTSGCPLDLRGARLSGRLSARMADVDVDLRDAVLAGPAALTRRAGRVRVTSLDRLDAAALTLTGIDLSTCGLGRLRHPESLTLSECVFAATPHGVRLGLGWPPIRWWTARRVLADEHAWRGWSVRPEQPLDAGRVAHLYERLRQAVDDKKIAADFAFGAMDMRRLASERGRMRLLLSIYWLACGYGLRMGRTLGWLALLTAVVAGVVYWSSDGHPSRRPVSHRSPHPVPAVHATAARAG